MARRLAQENVLRNETAFAAGEQCATEHARYLPVDGLGSSFDFDELIKCFAVRALKEDKCRWPAETHLRAVAHAFPDVQKR
jgi:hypothetical protein